MTDRYEHILNLQAERDALVAALHERLGEGAEP